MTAKAKILLLAGTLDARRLAECLPRLFPNAEITASFAGAVSTLPELGVPTRVGGFGGSQGLAHFCRSNGIDLLIDATHSFAATISHNAVSAATEIGIPHFRLLRPQWQSQSGDRWHKVADLEEAAEVLPRGSRPFIAVGRKEIGRFCHRIDVRAITRMIEPPAAELPKGWELLLSRPNVHVEKERQLLAAKRITHVVSKNSGGDASYAKIEAARELKLPVILVQRPPLPDAPCFKTVEDLCQAITPWISPA